MTPDIAEQPRSHILQSSWGGRVNGLADGGIGENESLEQSILTC